MLFLNLGVNEAILNLRGNDAVKTEQVNSTAHDLHHHRRRKNGIKRDGEREIGRKNIERGEVSRNDGQQRGVGEYWKAALSCCGCWLSREKREERRERRSLPAANNDWTQAGWQPVGATCGAAFWCFFSLKCLLLI
ncbi:hypothetical protein Csa_021830 [Cucumis sativus]|uniref:Uncharacterized protein n=1 Tax=Cucumis sativus TaxID=3659 RepID=A0A0A0LT89_CUCSA|nr:hypothetical protein Csa_021830 [Cucumis sativus]